MQSDGRDTGAAPRADDQAFRGSASVRLSDNAATILITAGGLSVIAAVLGICLYLVYVTVPLLAPGRADSIGVSSIERGSDRVALFTDEYLRSVAVLQENGLIEHRDSVSGDLIATLSLGADEAETPRVVSADAVSGFVSAQIGDDLVWFKLGFEYTVRPQPGGEGTVSEPLDDGRFRVTRVELESSGRVEAGGEIVHADVLDERRRTLIAAVDQAGALRLWAVVKSRSLLGSDGPGQAQSIDASSVPTVVGAAGVVLLADGQCIVVTTEGRFTRTRLGRSDAAVVETGELWSGPTRITALSTLLGRQTLVAGTGNGRVGSWWIAADPANPEDAGVLVSGPTLPRDESGVTELAPSQRDRTLFAGHEDGSVRVVHASSGKLIASAELGSAVALVGPGPKLDGFAALGRDGELLLAGLNVGHPDVTFRSLFGSMLYEGQREPMYVYQASGATDAAEPKLSLVPLIFGTLKATVVSMLFAAPIAVLAAIYTSEFLSSRIRRVVKPLIETMASLPSVVLGFVAAMVIAPFIADHLATVLAAVVVVPAVILVMSGVFGIAASSKYEAHGSTLLPLHVVAWVLGGIAIAVVLASPLERTLFAPSQTEVLSLAGAAQANADAAALARAAEVQAEFERPSVAVKGWLGGVFGGAFPGWFVLLTPVAALVFSAAVWPTIAHRIPAVGDARWGPLARILASAAVGVLLAIAAAAALQRGGLDPRDSILGVFTQRNTFVIGIVMGFAIIPIIYTISDDALQSVPSSLRAASLGAGATRWQTTVRVVMPVAASGIFSATMIGLGRAVGETMIVLMATGNTPVMDWNIFEGLRTLSANIAVELPEAERGGTHYRLLFLCGVVLFVMTFVVNTTAEIVRQRFRKRNALL